MAIQANLRRVRQRSRRPRARPERGDRRARAAAPAPAAGGEQPGATRDRARPASSARSPRRPPRWRPSPRSRRSMFVALDTTFGAPRGRRAAVHPGDDLGAPPTLDVGTRSLPRIRPFLQHSAGAFHRPRSRASSPRGDLARDRRRAGGRRPRASPLARPQRAARRRRPRRCGASTTTRGPRRHRPPDRRRTTSSRRRCSFVTPAQTVCNYGTLLFRNLASLLRPGDGLGTWQRFIASDPPERAPNNEGTPVVRPRERRCPQPGENYLHTTRTRTPRSPGQTRECEAGNEGYLIGQQVIGNVPGNQGTSPDGAGNVMAPSGRTRCQ